jgi:fatty-acyl-CoA synthase
MTMTAPDWIAHHALCAPNRTAMTDVHSGRSFTYDEMDRRCSRLASFFRSECGVGKGDRVAVIAHNSTDIFEVQFACRKLGAAFVPLNWRLSKSELRSILVDAEPVLVVNGSEFENVVDYLRAEGVGAKFIDVRDGGASTYEAGIANAAPLTRVERVTHDDIFAIMYTSGTTGMPKGAIITHRMAVFTGVNGMMKAQVNEASTGLTFLPLFHVGGLFLMANLIFHAGGRNILMRTFDAEAAFSLLADPVLRISHAFGVPTNFLMMAQLPSFARRNLFHVKCLTVGGAPSPLSLLEAYAAKGIRLQQGWGMTETATLGTMLPPEAAMSKIGSAGRPVMHAEIAIFDESFQPVAAGFVGQLVIRGPTVTPGYWKQPEATAKAFHDGWFLTGDAARQDEDGFFYIVDRWKDMYISGGENVYPAEVESVLQAIRGVIEAAVIGVPDEKWGEAGCAYLAVREGFNLSRTEILTACGKSLARFKLPKHVRIIDNIPHTAAGKISKPELRALFTKDVEMRSDH